MRLGWSPNASTPSLIDRLLGRAGRARLQPPREPPLPSTPLPIGEVTVPKD